MYAAPLVPQRACLLVRVGRQLCVAVHLRAISVLNGVRLQDDVGPCGGPKLTDSVQRPSCTPSPAMEADRRLLEDYFPVGNPLSISVIVGRGLHEAMTH